jgi:hypothetical protein
MIGLLPENMGESTKNSLTPNLYDASWKGED